MPEQKSMLEKWWWLLHSFMMISTILSYQLFLMLSNNDNFCGKMIILQPSFFFLKYLPMLELRHYVEAEIYVILVLSYFYWKEMSHRIINIWQLCSLESLENKSEVIFPRTSCSSTESECRISFLLHAGGGGHQTSLS